MVFRTALGRLCIFCGETVDPREGFVCPECARQIEEHRLLIRPEENLHNVALYRYRGTVRRGLHRFKYGGRAEFGKVCGRMLADRFRARREQADVITCVPRAKDGRPRLYNQSKLLARTMAKDLKIPFDPHLLSKRKGFPSQTDCPTPRAREENAKRAYRSGRSRRDLRGKRVVLVDDLYTTGATAAACEKLLRKRGAAKVLVYTATAAVWEYKTLKKRLSAECVRVQFGDVQPFCSRKFFLSGPGKRFSLPGEKSPQTP